MARVLRNYQHKDFSYLLQTQPVQEEPTIENIDIVKVVSAARRRRDSLLANRRLKYVITKSGRIHDRDCPTVARIADEDFDMCGDYPNGRELCYMCCRRAMVRRGLQVEQTKYIDAAIGLFDRLGATNKEIKFLFIDHDAVIKKVEKDSICLKVNDDCWILRLAGKKCLLYHNNYCMIGQTQRLICDDFHLQSSKSVDLQNALLVICGYTWEGHLKHKEERQREALKTALAQVQNIRRIPRFSLFFRYYDILDYEDWAANALQKKRFVRVLRQDDMILRCKVLQWKVSKFQALAEELKDYCVERMFTDYPHLCLEAFGKEGDPGEKRVS